MASQYQPQKAAGEGVAQVVVVEQTGREEQNEIAKEDRAGGADVFQFKADSTPEEKMAQAKKVCKRRAFKPASTVQLLTCLL